MSILLPHPIPAPRGYTPFCSRTLHALFSFVTAAIAAGWATHSVQAQERWEIVVPHQRASLFAIGRTATDRAVAVGEKGTIRIISATGAVSRYAFSGTTVSLRGIDFANETLGIIVGDDGVMLRSSDGGEHWEHQVSNTGRDLAGIRFSSPATGFAVGTNGTLLRTTDGGITWHHRESGTTKDLTAITFLNPSVGLITADSGMMLHTSDGGEHWQIIQSSSARKLLSISMIDAEQWIVGGSDGELLKTFDGGNEWFQFSNGLSGKFQFNGIHFFNADYGYAVGYEIWSTAPLSIIPRLVYTTNGGTSWKSGGYSTGWGDGGITALSDDIGLAVGKDGSIIRVEYMPNASSIRSATVAYGGSVAYVGASCADARNCIAVSNATLFNYDPATSGENRPSGVLVERTEDGGKTWQPDALSEKILWQSETRKVRGVYAFDSLLNFAVGDSGLLLRTVDGGTTWTVQGSNTTKHLESIVFSNHNNGIAVGYQGALLRTTDGGENWNSISEFPALDLVAAASPSPGTYVVYSVGKILRSVDNGITWTQHTIPQLNRGVGLSFSDSLYGWIGTSHITPGNPGDGANDYILKTTDGGVTWTTKLDQAIERPLGLIDISFSDRENGIAIGPGGKILRTIDGGETWKQQNSTLDERGITYGSKVVPTDAGLISAVAHPAPDIAIAVTNSGSIIRYNPLSAHDTIAPPLPSHAYCGVENQPTTLTVQWSVATGSARYRIQVSTSSSFEGNPIVDIQDIESNQYTVGGLQQNTRYYWRVHGYNDAVTSDWSSTCSFTTAGTGSVGGHSSSIALSSLRLWPNPATRTVSIQFDLASASEAEVLVYDVFGREVSRTSGLFYTEGTQQFTQDISYLAAGSYYIGLHIHGQRLGMPFTIMQ